MKLHRVRRRLRRGASLVSLVSRFAADGRSRGVLFRAYRDLFRNRPPTDEILEIRGQVFGRVFELRLRREDLFTLEEVFHQQDYRLVTRLAPRATIIDAGANIGMATLWFIAAHPGSHVHAFEPEAANVDLLRRNVASLSEVTVVHAGLGAAAGPAMLHLSDHPATHSLVGIRSGRRQQVQLRRLDAYLDEASIDHVELLKMDVEGAEQAVLEGLGERIDAVRVIAGECHENHVDVHRFYRFLEDRGFRMVRKRPVDDDPEVHLFEVAR